MRGPVSWPFGVPAGTTLRFCSLILLAVGATGWNYARIGATWRISDTGNGLARCEVHSGYYLPMGIRVELSAADQVRYDHYERCVQSLTPGYLWWAFGSIAGLALLTLLFFTLQPWWRTVRGRLVPLDGAGSTDALGKELATLTGRAGLAGAPRFLLQPANPRPTGWAFGGFGGGRIALSAGLLKQRTREPERFRAVVLHELAHLRNKDVIVTYLTLAVWRAFAAFTLVPALATLADPWLLTTTPGRAPWQLDHAALGTSFLGEASLFAVMAGLVLVARTAVLRSRERYADARAAQWLEPGAMSRVLSAGTTDGTRWWHSHPLLRDRVRALQAPESLSRPGFWEGFTAAFALQLAAAYGSMTLLNAVGDNPDATTQIPPDVKTVLFAVLLVMTGLRGAAYLEAGGMSRRVCVRAGAGLGLGLAAAQALVVLHIWWTLPGIPDAELDPLTLSSVVLFAAAVVVIVTCACAWAGRIARLPVVRTPGPHRYAVLLAATAVCWAALHWWDEFAEGAPGISGTLHDGVTRWVRLAHLGHWTPLDVPVIKAVMFPWILIYAFGVPLLIASVLFWALPLLLGAVAAPVVRSALRAGAVAAGVWLVVDLVLRALAHATVPAPVRAGDGFALVLVCWELLAVVVAQFLSGVYLGTRCRDVLPTALAATVTATACTLCLWVLHLTGSCVPPLAIGTAGCPDRGDIQVAFMALRFLGPFGVVAGVLGMLLGAALRRWRTRGAPLRPATGTQRPPESRTRSRRLLAGLLAVAVGYVAVLQWQPPGVRGVALVTYVRPDSHTDAIVDSEYSIWLTGGGSEQFAQVLRGYAETNEAVYLIVGHKTPAARGVTVLKRWCGFLEQAARQAERFPAPPGVGPAAHWTYLLRTSERMVTTCDAVKGPDIAAISAVSTPVAPLEEVLDDEQAAMRRLSR